MSFEADNVEHEQSVQELIEENTRWLQTIAFLLGKIAGEDADQIHEDIE